MIANSLTGLVISVSTAGFVLMMYLLDALPPDSNLWSLVFAVEVALYLATLAYLTSIQPKTQYTDPL